MTSKGCPLKGIHLRILEKQRSKHPNTHLEPLPPLFRKATEHPNTHLPATRSKMSTIPALRGRLRQARPSPRGHPQDTRPHLIDVPGNDPFCRRCWRYFDEPRNAANQRLQVPGPGIPNKLRFRRNLGLDSGCRRLDEIKCLRCGVVIGKGCGGARELYRGRSHMPPIPAGHQAGPRRGPERGPGHRPGHRPVLSRATDQRREIGS